MQSVEIYKIFRLKQSIIEFYILIVEFDFFQARNLSLVSHPDIPIKNYAGYFTVNKKYNSNLFFWFFPAKVNAADAPVVLWLQGNVKIPWGLTYISNYYY